jgi:hypothetical protein
MACRLLAVAWRSPLLPAMATLLPALLLPENRVVRPADYARSAALDPQKLAGKL